MALAEWEPAARKAAAAVAMVERAPDRGRNRAGAGADLDDPPVRIVPHDHTSGIAGQTVHPGFGPIGKRQRPKNSGRAMIFRMIPADRASLGSRGSYRRNL